MKKRKPDLRRVPDQNPVERLVNLLTATQRLLKAANEVRLASDAIVKPLSNEQVAHECEVSE